METAKNFDKQEIYVWKKMKDSEDIFYNCLLFCRKSKGQAETVPGIFLRQKKFDRLMYVVVILEAAFHISEPIFTILVKFWIVP